MAAGIAINAYWICDFVQYFKTPIATSALNLMMQLLFIFILNVHKED